jgi:hypothetical protein
MELPANPIGAGAASMVTPLPRSNRSFSFRSAYRSCFPSQLRKDESELRILTNLRRCVQCFSLPLRAIDIGSRTGLSDSAITQDH